MSMYDAKHNGRDRYEVAHHPSPTAARTKATSLR
jgi:hypothetical protein